jgi:predicted transposase/invertase (TIGR01784 family)
VSHWHSVFELRERQTGVIFSDQLQLHVLEIPKFGLTADELGTPLERWVYFLKHGAELDPDQRPQALHGPDYQQALQEMKRMTQSELERERYESRLKAQRDFSTALREARTEGLAAGLIRQIHFCQRLLRRPMTAMEELQALPLTELERLVQNLEVELEPSPPS